jgi:integrase
LRWSEACGLRRQDVALNSGTMTVAKQRVQVGWKVKESDPKADLNTIKDMLGHSSITITADTYTSVLPEVAREAAEAARLVPRARTSTPGLTGCQYGCRGNTPEGVSTGQRGGPSGTRTLNPRIKKS